MTRALRWSDMDSEEDEAARRPRSPPGTWLQHEILDEALTETTLVVRGVRRDLDADAMWRLLRGCPFSRACRFLHVPQCLRTERGRGYALLDFASTLSAHAFALCLPALRGLAEEGGSVVASWHSTQGEEALVRCYRNRAIMHTSVPAAHQPLLLRDGRSIPFPPPTVALRPPRPRGSFSRFAGVQKTPADLSLHSAPLRLVDAGRER